MARPWLSGIGDEAGAPLVRQIEAVRRLGWDRIELRTVDGLRVAELSDAEVRNVAAALDDAGLEVCAISSNIGAWGRSIATPLEHDLDELEALARRAEALGGARTLRVMSWTAEPGVAQGAWGREAIRRMCVLAERAERLDMLLLHENCAGWGGQGSRETLELLAAVDSDALGVLLDIGNCVAYGQDPVEMTRAVARHAVHVHVKDAVVDAGDVRFVELGAGEARLADCFALLRAAGYAGGLSLEPHLHTRPHEGALAADATALDDFVAFGRALERLVDAAWGAAPAPSA